MRKFKKKTSSFYIKMLLAEVRRDERGCRTVYKIYLEDIKVKL